MSRHDMTSAALALALALFTTGAAAVDPVASFQALGYFDVDHVDPTNGRARSTLGSPKIGSLGQTAGQSARYTATGGDNGSTAWLFDGQTQWQIGFTDAQHTGGTYRSSTVTDMNRRGVAVGISLRYDRRGRFQGQSAWVSDGPTTVRVGFTGPEYTQSTTGYQASRVYRVYQNGWMLGVSSRFAPDGQSAGATLWMSDGRRIIPWHGEYSLPLSYNERGDVAGVTGRTLPSGAEVSYAWRWRAGDVTPLGLRDDEHIRPLDGRNQSSLTTMNERGQVYGGTIRWAPNSDGAGDSAWVFDGSTVMRIGLRGPAYDRADGYHGSYGRGMNDRGQVMGATNRWDARGEYIGDAAWRATNGHTVRVGPHDAQHTNRRDKFQSSKPMFINHRGDIAGTANRYRPYGGRSAWLDIGATVHMVGLQDADHTDPDYRNQWSDVVALNAAGQVIGSSQRFLPVPGDTAWFYDPATRTTTPIEADGLPVIAQLLDDTGRVSGIFAKAARDGTTQPWLFTWTVAQGAHTLGPGQVRVDGGLAPLGLTSLDAWTPAGVVRGMAVFGDGDMTAPFVMRPLPH